ncbi:EpsG family protein, partial [Staphylococcus aureus]|uniref:EpsG family protein n=1 Tax=Staphylococcus aureus TaxID=1280 RepID=UPI00301DE1C7
MIFSYVTLIYLNSLNAMRQEIATTILLYALFLLLEGRTKSYILLVLFATGFHYVSVLMLPFVFINKLKYNKKTICITVFLSILFIRFGVVN